MDCKTTSDRPSVRRTRAGATLPETLVAMGVAGLVLLSLGALYLYSTRSFVTLRNHLDLDSLSARAMDRIGREIRQATRVVTFSTNRVTFSRAGTPFSYVFSAQERALFREDGTNRIALLSDCDFVRFDFYQRTPQTGGKGFHRAANPNECKVVQVTWQSSRTTGASSPNNAYLRSAQIVIRNQRPL